MFRRAFGSGFLVVVLALTGCTMCCHPYDRCGPVYTQGCYSCTHGRVGSVFEGTTQPIPDQTQVARRSKGNVQARTGGPTKLGIVPGSEKIISVTDRTVTPSSSAGESSVAAAETPTEPAKPLPSSGWTARRPATDVQR
jgi:hypothetical protein